MLQSVHLEVYEFEIEDQTFLGLMAIYAASVSQELVEAGLIGIIFVVFGKSIQLENVLLLQV